MKKQYFYFLPTLFLIIFNINIFNAQNAPVFTTTPTTSLNEGQLYKYIIETSDTDGDAVTITAPTLPPWLSINGQPAGTVTTFAGEGTYGYLDGTATVAQFKFPYGIAVDSDGNIYVSDMNSYRIRKITSAGVVTTLAGSGVSGYADGTGTAAQFDDPRGLAIDGSGNIYVADSRNNRIRKITPSGVVTTLAGSGVSGYADGTGTTAKFKSPNDVTVDSDGNVYVADFSNHSIRKITPAGVVTTMAGSFSNGYAVSGYADGTGSAAKFNGPSGVAVDNSGNVYVSEWNNYRIRKVTPAGVVTTLAGSGVAGYADGTGTAAKFNRTQDVTVDASGNVYVADQYNHRIRKVTPAGVVTTLAGSGVAGYADGFGTAAKFNYPAGVTVDANNNVYVADKSNSRIRKIAGPYTLTGDSSGNTGTFNVVLNANDGNGGSTDKSFTIKVNSLPTFTSTPTASINEDQVYNYVIETNDADGNYVTITASSLPSWLSLDSNVVTTVAGYYTGFVNGTGTDAKFDRPVDLAVDSSGNVYVADQGNHSIRKITPAGVVTTLAGSGVAGYADGTGTAAQFDTPTGVAVDGSGNVYVADHGNHRIRKITPAGVVTTLAGSGVTGYADGTGIAAQFMGPQRVAVSSDGSFYIADNHRIRKLTSAGVVTTFAGSTTYGYAEGTGTAAKFDNPNGIAVDGDGNLYVADQYNYRIRKITPAGVVTTLAGSGVSGYADGTGTAAQFDKPKGVTVDSYGNVFVADGYNRRIRKITPAGVVTTLAGDGTYGSVDGIGTAAQFVRPTGIAEDGTGNLYVADQDNNRIRKIAGAYTLTGDCSGNVGTYSITLNADDGNGGTAVQNFTLTVNATLGLEDVILKGFALYPNPVNTVLNISAKEEIKQIQIFSLLGQQIMQKVNNSNEIHLNLNKLSQGVYFVKVFTKDKAKVVKIIKQ